MKLSESSPDRRQSKTLFTIDERGSKIARNSVFNCHLSPVGRQMPIENSVSNNFWSEFVDCINVFDCHLSGVESRPLIWFYIKLTLLILDCKPILKPNAVQYLLIESERILQKYPHRIFYGTVGTKQKRLSDHKHTFVRKTKMWLNITHQILYLELLIYERKFGSYEFQNKESFEPRQLCFEIWELVFPAIRENCRLAGYLMMFLVSESKEVFIANTIAQIRLLP